MTTELIQLAQPGAFPTPEQEERLQARRRFNRLAVYLPLGVLVFLWLLLIAGLIWLTVAGQWFYVDTNQEYYRGLVSGVADAVLVLMLAPLMLLCSVPIVAGIAMLVWNRRRRTGHPYGTLPPLFWRIDNLVNRARAGIISFLPRLANPVIAAHGSAAYARTLLLEFKKLVSRR
jgi:uncharacterized membrane protein YjgN (DUF898 family)